MKTNKTVRDYKDYINKHKKCVEKAFYISKPFLKEILNKEELSLLSKNVKIHDNSKFQEDEFFPYAEYFYGNKDKAKNSFEQAKTLHKSRNPHHPEYWKINNEEMPKVYVAEMVLDWWAFSIMKNNPKEIFNFYNENKEKLNLTTKETQTVEQILLFIEKSQEETANLPKINSEKTK